MASYRLFLRSLWQAVRSEHHQLAIMAWLVGALILLGAAGFYALERNQPVGPLEALYWATITVTGVGYGDVVPLTRTGRVLASVVSLLGIGSVLLLTGIVAAGFVREIDQQHRMHTDAATGPGDDVAQKCPHCGARLARPARLER